jgi:hypothetical protein
VKPPRREGRAAAHTTRRVLGLLALVLPIALRGASAAPGGPGAGTTPPPRLVLVISIDQLRADRLSPELPGGLGRLAREGRLFADAAHDHSDTETCPGHAVMLTGAQPGAAGVPSNEWVDRTTGRSHYCVEDAGPQGQILGAPATEGGPGAPVVGRSPRFLRASALGDWMKQADPRAKVFSVSAKDRAAITLGGLHPDGVYWLDRGAVLGFTTSRYYRPELPSWVGAWHGADPFGSGWLASVPPSWEHATGEPPNGARPDDFPGESTQFSRTSPHPLRAADVKGTLERVYFSPWLDALTLSFARTLIEQEQLGTDDVTDLLAVSLSATDLVGHAYGPGSQEARDALLRLDLALGELLDFAAARVGRDRLLVALTADHGVLELPEALEATGADECPVGGGRVATAALREGLGKELAAKLGAAPEGAPWIVDSGFALTLGRAAAKARGVPLERVASAASAWLAKQPGVARVWTAAEIEAGRGPEPFAHLYAHSYDPEKSGDLVIQPARDCLFSPYPTGTSHGTPYLYDRAVPLVLQGPAVEPGVVRGRAAPVDLGPTLAALLGVPVPPGRDGRSLLPVSR